MTLVNNAAEQKITLIADGVVVSGVLIKEDDWFQQQPALQRISTTAARLFPEKQSAYECQEERAGRHVEPTPAYLHLKNARYTLRTETDPGSDTRPGTGGFFWRGRFDRVTAWSVDGLAGTSAAAQATPGE